MTLKHFSPAIAIACIFLNSCGSGLQQPAADGPSNSTMKEPGDKGGSGVETDHTKGNGKFTEVKLTHPLDKEMIKNGTTIYNVKCASCHKLTNEKLVGPGWQGVTDRRKPEWIMNFSTNTDEMIDRDPSVQAMVEECMVRMPNQHLSDDEARNVLEFMRKNDGKN